MSKYVSDRARAEGEATWLPYAAGQFYFSGAQATTTTTPSSSQPLWTTTTARTRTPCPFALSPSTLSATSLYRPQLPLSKSAPAAGSAQRTALGRSKPILRHSQDRSSLHYHKSRSVRFPPVTASISPEKIGRLHEGLFIARKRVSDASQALQRSHYLRHTRPLPHIKSVPLRLWAS